jgi:hypothetical protein
MKEPAKLVFSDEASFRLSRADVWGFLATIAGGFAYVLVFTDATPRDLALPFAALSSLWLFWVVLLGAIALGRRMGERRGIKRMFDGGIWECWQIRSSDWQALVEREADLIRPKDEGLKAYSGAVYSSMVGLVIAVAMIAVGILAMEDPVGRNVMWIGAAVVFLLALGIGLFQPLLARREAHRYQRKALRVPEPRVWFASDGVYHEALGYTSLKELEKVTDRTRSRKAIQFTLAVSTETSDTATSSVAQLFAVPPGCEDRAGKLVRRYRQERLSP